jgi:hypothetical protein
MPKLLLMMRGSVSLSIRAAALCFLLELGVLILLSISPWLLPDFWFFLLALTWPWFVWSATLLCACYIVNRSYALGAWKTGLFLLFAIFLMYWISSLLLGNSFFRDLISEQKTVCSPSTVDNLGDLLPCFSHVAQVASLAFVATSLAPLLFLDLVIRTLRWAHR